MALADHTEHCAAVQFQLHCSFCTSLFSMMLGGNKKQGQLWDPMYEGLTLSLASPNDAHINPLYCPRPPGIFALTPSTTPNPYINPFYVLDHQ